MIWRATRPRRTIPRRRNEPVRPFHFERAPGSAALYARQRALMRRAMSGGLSALEAEEETLSIVSDVIRLAREHAGTASRRRAEASARRRELAEAARAELARAPFENRSVTEIARELGYVAIPFVPCVPRADGADNARVPRGDQAASRDQ